MDRGTVKPEIPESLVTDGIIHDLASTDWTASLQNELSTKVMSDFGVTGHQVDNSHKCEIPSDIRPDSPDLQQYIKQNTSIPAVKQEFIYIFPKREITEDVFKEEINDNPTKGEIQEYIKLSDAINCPQFCTVRTDTQPVIIKNKIAEDGTQQDFESPIKSGKLLIIEEKCKVKIENCSIEPTVRNRLDLVVTGAHEDIFCKCEHQEDVKHDALMPAVKPEMMEIVIKKEETDVVLKEEIHDNLIKEEIQDCKEYIKLEDGMKSPRDNLTEIVKTELQPVIMKNELSEKDGLQEERINGNSDKEDWKFFKRVCKTRILPRAVTVASFNKGSDFGESDFLSSGEESDHEEDGNKCSKSKHQPHNNKRQKNITSVEAEEYVPQKGDRWHGDKKKSGQKLCRDTDKIHSGDSPHQCEVCAKYFKTSITLRNHLRLHSDQMKSSHQKWKPFLCADCGKSFSQLCNLKKHQLIHTGKKFFACEICDKTFAQSSGLHQHKKTHQAVRPVSCSDCGKSFSQLCNLKRHQLVHMGKKLFSCADCGKFFSQLSNLKRHQLLHTGKKLFVCEICDKTFAQTTGLHQHMITHQEVKLYSCTECGKSFSQLCNLKSHQLLHTGKKLFTCEICDKTFAQPAGLSKHMITHQEVKPFSCTVCNKFFSQLCNLKTHQLLHTGKKLYACEICDKSYAQPGGLRQHMKTHQKVTLSSCSDCGKSFSMLSDLKRHQLIHTGKKLYACKICDKSFTQHSGLHQHKITHQEVKPFSCADCGKSFSYLCNLKKHQFLHSGKKLFACEICDKSFTQPSRLLSHKKRLH